jgi:hypothetical protein
MHLLQIFKAQKVEWWHQGFTKRGQSWNMHCDKRRWHGIEVIYKWKSTTLFFFKNLFWFCLVLPSFYLFAYVSFLSLFFLFTMLFFIKDLLYLAFFPLVGNFSLIIFSISTTLSLFQLVSCCLSLSYLSFFSNFPFLSFHSYFFSFYLFLSIFPSFFSSSLSTTLSLSLALPL